MPDMRLASPNDHDEVVEIIVDSFFDDPIMKWLFPDSAQRPSKLEAMFGLLAKHAYLPAGQCQLGDDAAALWLPSGTEIGEGFWDTHGAAYAESIGDDIGRSISLGATMHENHPSGPHRYLLALGVRPSRQGRGLGSRLLERALNSADASGEFCYLEASSPRSRVLYERHGFETIGEFSVDDSPSMWPMLRPPG